MGIEARGAKLPFVVAHSAYLLRPERGGVILRRYNVHTHIFDVADSQDEAAGRAVRHARMMFPLESGWTGHWHQIIPLSGFDWLGRCDETKLKPQPMPWEE